MLRDIPIQDFVLVEQTFHTPALEEVGRTLTDKTAFVRSLGYACLCFSSFFIIAILSYLRL